MTKHLWDIDIETLNLGWEETYQDALKNCPNGEIIPSTTMTDVEHVFSRHIYHPVGYRKKIIELFNRKKAEAISVLEKQSDLQTLTNEIFKIDVCLFSLLTSWVTLDEELETSFDPKEIETNMFNVETYFAYDKDDSIFSEQIKNLVKYKFIRV